MAEAAITTGPPTVVDGIDWSPTATYNAGDIVIYDGRQWIAQAKNTGKPPNGSMVWKQIGEPGPSPDIQPWNSTMPYNTGDNCLFNDALQTARVDNQAQRPDVAEVWYDDGPPGAPPPESFPPPPGPSTPWSPSVQYSVGTQVTNNGRLWVANATNLNQVPGASMVWNLNGPPGSADVQPWNPATQYVPGNSSTNNGTTWFTEVGSQGQVPGRAPVWADQGPAPAA